MAINISAPDLAELKPRITVFGVGGGGCNAVNNMIDSNLTGVEFVVANTDAQALAKSPCERKIQMGIQVTRGLGAGSQPEIGAQAAEEALGEIVDHLSGSNMVFITAGMGGGTGTGAAPVIAREARREGILTVGVVTKPFNFEGRRRMAIAERGIDELAQNVDTLIVIPNQNLFRVANEATSFTAAFAMADQVLYSGVASITELMTKEGLINLDFADVRAVMSDMGKAMMGTGEATGDNRAEEAALAAISNPLLDIESMAGARGVLISIAGGPDLTLYEVDQAASRIREEVDPDANIIVGATIEEDLEGTMRVSVVATGLQEEGEMAATDGATRVATEATAHTTNTTGGNTVSMTAPGVAPVGAPVYPRPETVGAGNTDGQRQLEEHGVAQPAPEEEAPRSQTPPEPPQIRQSEDVAAAEPFEEELPFSSAPEEHDEGVSAPVDTPRGWEISNAHRPMTEAPARPPRPRTPPRTEGREPASAPTTERPGGGANIRISDLPPNIQQLVEKKQEHLKKLGGKAPSGSKRRKLFGIMKGLLGAGQSAPEDGMAQERTAPQAGGTSNRPARERGPDMRTLLEDDDDLNIPAFLRRGGAGG